MPSRHGPFRPVPLLILAVLAGACGTSADATATPIVTGEPPTIRVPIIVDTDLDTIRIGQRVKVVFKKPESGFSVPMFAPE